MRLPTQCRRGLRIVALLAAAGAAAGCAGVDGLGESVFEPTGKYRLFTCKEIDARARTVRVRERELAEAMHRAQQAPGGDLVNVLAYRTDYLRARGELKVLDDTAAEKKCPPAEDAIARPPMQ